MISDYLEIKPVSTDGLHVVDEVERMLKKVTGSAAVFTGWEKDPVTGNKKFVPRESQGTMKGKHRCYDQGKWDDRDSLNDPIPNPNSKFGIAYVGLDDMDRADHAIEELDRTGFANSIIRVRKVKNDPANMDIQG